MVSYKRLMEIYEEEMSGVFTTENSSTNPTATENETQMQEAGTTKTENLSQTKRKESAPIQSRITFLVDDRQVQEYLRKRGLLKEKGGVE